MNQLKVSIQQSIIVLTTRGWSRRRIARELGVDRATVGRQLRRVRAEANAATNPALGFRPGPPSICVPFVAEIEAALRSGLSAKRIHQDLTADHGFRGGYTSVKQFVHWLGQVHALPFRRMECEPGDERQVDFGQGAWIAEEGRRRRRPHLFRVVLSHSRKGSASRVASCACSQLLGVPTR